VFVQAGAGAAIGLDDEQYQQAVPRWRTAAEVFAGPR
jgi:alanine dehydrogenase